MDKGKKELIPLVHTVSIRLFSKEVVYRDIKIKLGSFS
jgi:hypothetical protein